MKRLSILIASAAMLITSNSFAQNTTEHNEYGNITPGTGTISWHRFNTSYGSIDLGPANSGWAHIYSSAPKFIFNRDVHTTTGGFASYSNNPMSFKTGSTYLTRMTILSSGQVGIGTTTPNYLFHVRNSSMSSGTAMRIDAINGQMRIFETDDPNNTNNYTQIERNGGNFHIYHKDYNINGGTFVNVLSSTMDGKIGMGVSVSEMNTPGNYRLYVADGILTEQVKVSLRSTAQWADYVFDEGYKLMPLNQVEAFIALNKHLPNVPSAEETVSNGINVAEMDAKLLEKIEELTLYTIQQQKEIEELKKLVLELTINK